MYNLKLGIGNDEAGLAEELERNISEENIKVIKSKGFLGNTEIVVAVIAATPVIITQIAGVIKAYMERNKLKSLKIKIDQNEISFSGYSIEEIEGIFNQATQNN